MSTTYCFNGYSDDTFGEYGVTNDDYDNCASGKPIRWRLTDEQGNGLLVIGQYGCNGADWLIGVEPLDDGPLPPWPIRIEQSDVPYSPALIIEAPDRCSLVCLERSKDDE